MKHEADLALCLTKEGTRLILEMLDKHPDRSEVLEKLGTARFHTGKDGGTLRYWDTHDFPDEGALSKFISNITSGAIPKAEYRIAFVSHYGGGYIAGEYANPFNLRLVEEPSHTIDYSPDGDQEPEPIKRETLRVLFPVVHSARIEHAKAADISTLQEELNRVYLDSLSNLSKGFVASDVHPYAIRPDNAGRDLIIRVMVHIDTDCTCPASGGTA